MTRRGPADLPSGPGKLDLKPARTTAGGGGLPVLGRAALIASVTASEVRAVRACLGPSCGRCEQAERAGLLDGLAAATRRASGTGDACASGQCSPTRRAGRRSLTRRISGQVPQDPGLGLAERLAQA